MSASTAPSTLVSTKEFTLPELHPYQEEMVRFMVKRGAAGLFADPGLGKTVSSLSAYHVLRASGFVKKALIICKLRPAHFTWPREIVKWRFSDAYSFDVIHGPHKLRKLEALPDLAIINPDGLDWLFDHQDLLRGNYDCLIVDECFRAGTPVETPNGRVPIESIRAGDSVFTSSGVGCVLRTHRRTSQRFVVLTFEDDRRISCTPNHPFFTDCGWVCAGNLEGCLVYDATALQELRQEFFGGGTISESSERRLILWETLQAEISLEDQRRISKDNGVNRIYSPSGLEQRSSLDGGRACKNQQHSEISRPASFDSWWERAWVDRASESFARSIRLAMESGTRHSIGRKAAWLSNLLQGRFSIAGYEIGNRSGWLNSHGAEKLGQKERFKAGGVRVVSVESVELGSAEPVFDLEIEGTPHYFANGCLVHNSSTFKHSNTLRFKLLKKMLPIFRRRYIMTGSPAANGLMNLFGQAYLLDYGAALGRFITHFRAKYFLPDGPFGWKLKDGAEEKIYAALSELVIRHDAKEELGLPDVINDDRTFTLPDDARAVYDELERELITQIDGGVVTAVNSGVATQKLRQVANGAVYDGDKTVRHVHDGKVETLRELVDELNGAPLLVGYEFKPDLEAMLKAFPGVPHIGGGVSLEKQAKALEAWDAGDLPVFPVQIESASHGLNMQGGPGHHLAFFAMSWDWESTDQLIRRLNRQGQKKQVVVHWIKAENTVDEPIYASLMGKDGDQQRFFKALKDYAATRQV